MENEIHLASLADSKEDLLHIDRLKTFCSRVKVQALDLRVSKIRGALSLLRGAPFSAGYFYSPVLAKIVWRWMEEETYDGIICFCSPMAGYIYRSPLASCLRSYKTQARAPPLGARPVMLMDFVDLDSDKWAQYAQSSSFPMKLIYLLESRRLLEYAKKVNQAFDHSIFVSQQEADLFKKRYPNASNISVIPNGVDYRYFSPTNPAPSLPNCPVLLFTGAMDYHANVDGVLWFSNEIFPLIKRQVPNCEFFIVGSRPAPKVRELADREGIVVTGFVEDIRPYYEKATVCVIPLRLARGIQNKILEAMSMARPVVTTGKALEGIKAVPGRHVVVADSAPEFAKGVIELMGDPTRRVEMGQAARDFVIQNHDWAKNMRTLQEVLSGRIPAHTVKNQNSVLL